MKCMPGSKKGAILMPSLLQPMMNNFATVVLTFVSVDEPSHGAFCFSTYHPMKFGNLVEF